MALTIPHTQYSPFVKGAQGDALSRFLDMSTVAYGLFSSRSAHAQWRQDRCTGSCSDNLSGPSLLVEKQRFIGWMRVLGLEVPDAFLEVSFFEAFYKGYQELCPPNGCSPLREEFWA